MYPGLSAPSAFSKNIVIVFVAHNGSFVSRDNAARNVFLLSLLFFSFFFFSLLLPPLLLLLLQLQILLLHFHFFGSFLWSLIFVLCSCVFLFIVSWCVELHRLKSPTCHQWATCVCHYCDLFALYCPMFHPLSPIDGEKDAFFSLLHFAERRGMCEYIVFRTSGSYVSYCRWNTHNLLRICWRRCHLTDVSTFICIGWHRYKPVTMPECGGAKTKNQTSCRIDPVGRRK